MVFTTKYSKNKPAKAPKVMKFNKGGRVPSDEDIRASRIDVENEMYHRSIENDKRTKNKFEDDGTRIPGWQAGRNDAFRERMGYQRLMHGPSFYKKEEE